MTGGYGRARDADADAEPRHGARRGADVGILRRRLARTGTGAARVAAAVDRRCRGDVFGVRRTAAADDRTRIHRLRSGRHICVGAGLADAISRATRSEPDLFVGPTGSGNAFNRVTVDLLVADGVSIGRLADLVDDPSMLLVLEIAEIVAGSRRVRVAR